MRKYTCASRLQHAYILIELTNEQLAQIVRESGDFAQPGTILVGKSVLLRLITATISRIRVPSARFPDDACDASNHATVSVGDTQYTD